MLSVATVGLWHEYMWLSQVELLSSKHSVVSRKQRKTDSSFNLTLSLSSGEFLVLCGVAWATRVSRRGSTACATASGNTQRRVHQLHGAETLADLYTLDEDDIEQLTAQLGALEVGPAPLQVKQLARVLHGLAKSTPVQGGDARTPKRRRTPAHSPRERA